MKKGKAQEGNIFVAISLSLSLSLSLSAPLAVQGEPSAWQSLFQGV